MPNSKRDLIANAIEAVRNFRFCGPSDDSDEQAAVTLGFRHLLIQLKRLAPPLLSENAAIRLNAIDVEVGDLYSAFEAKAELDTLLPDIESALETLDDAEKKGARTFTAKPLPIAVCTIVGEVLGSFLYSHAKIERLFYEAGAAGQVPEGSCVLKCQAWLKRLHTEVAEPVAILGRVLEVFMEVDDSYKADDQEKGRNKITEVLGRFGLSYHTGGRILGALNGLPTQSLNQILKDRNLAGVEKEFERALANVEQDPPAAITAACSILESLFKVYIEDNDDIAMPGDQSLMPLWKAARKHLGLNPAAIEDDDVRKVLSGMISLVDGIGSLRTHAGSAHGQGRRTYRLQARHARLAINASHTLVGFVLETWDERKPKEAL